MKNYSSLVTPWVSQQDIKHKILGFSDYNCIETSIGVLNDYSSLSFHCSFGFNNKFITRKIRQQTFNSLLTLSKFEQKIQTEIANKLINPRLAWPFSGISWGTDRVLQKTIWLANLNQIDFQLLQTKNDLDNLMDLSPWLDYKSFQLSASSYQL